MSNQINIVAQPGSFIDKLENRIFNALICNMPAEKAELLAQGVLQNVVNLISDHIDSELPGIEKHLAKTGTREVVTRLKTVVMLKEISQAAIDLKIAEIRHNIEELQNGISVINEMVAQSLMKHTHGKETIAKHRMAITQADKALKKLSAKN